MTIRAFFAIQVPESILSIAKEIKNALDLQTEDLRWSFLEHLHITLTFIPSLEKAHIPCILERVTDRLKHVKPFYLELGPLELFPNKRAPRLISLGMKPSKKCQMLVQILNEILFTMNYPIEARPFRGHLTLARFKTSSINKEILNTVNLGVIPNIRVSNVYLYESKPSHAGSEYIQLACIDLT